MNLPLIFATLFGGCCAGYEESNETWRNGYTQAELDAFLEAQRPATTGGTGSTFATGAPVPATTATADTGQIAESTDPDCTTLCDGYADTCSFVEPEGDEVVAVECTYFDYCVGGRLHAAIAPVEPAAQPSAVGAWLAQMAHDELASAHAFRLLADELRAHAAPHDLVERVLDAAGDELRHARRAREAARRHGATVPPVTLLAAPHRSLEDLAVENAVEGCVLETWLALSAWVQARDANAELRPLFAAIAGDETRHATLAHDLARWLRGRLSPEANRRVDAAQQQAVRALLARDVGAPAALGLPAGAERLRLLSGLHHQVWSGATGDK